jgi:hypothetical protein
MSNAICFDSTWKTPGRASEATRSPPSDDYLIVYLSSWLSQTWAMPSGKDMQRSPSLVVSLRFLAVRAMHVAFVLPGRLSFG